MDSLRADHVGSLLRPAELVQARESYEAGALEPAKLTEIEDQAILAALQRQQAAGVGVYTDGEFRRGVYMTVLTDALEGFMPGVGPRMTWRVDSGEVPEHAANFTLGVVTAPLRAKRRIAGREAAFLREHAPGPVKVCLPSPAHFRRAYQPEHSGSAYPDAEAFLRELTGILANEAAALAADGVTYLQVDAPTYSGLLDTEASAGLSPAARDAALAAMIAGDNAIIDAARKAGARTGVHVCRGNASGAWLASGGYEPIAEQVFGQLRCERLLLEYDTARAGGFEPLRLVPADKTVVLGLVSTKTGRLESREELLRRIEDAARYVPVERLALSPQCGFASNFRGNPLTEDDQWRKLELVASVASEVWG